MFRSSYIVVAATITLILAITHVYAAPSLSLGSNASYNLAGRLQASQNCTADPSTFAAQACGGMTLPPLNVTLNGAGSTFVLPLLSAIDSSYTRVNPSVRINYQAVGSATGITLLATKSVDFAASDAPLSNVQIVSVPNVLTIPETVGAVVIAYNIPINSTYSMQVYTSM